MPALELQTFDLYRRMNIQDHRTSAYLSQHLIVRRGQPFYISCTFTKPVQPEKDTVIILLETGGKVLDSPLSFEMPVFCRSTYSLQDWRASCVSLHGTTMTINIFIPTNAIIGKYKMTLQTANLAGFRKQHLGDFYVLYNPWGEDDDVYMPDEADRQEYVLNEIGIVYAGTTQRRMWRPWDYGQFEEKILEMTISLLERFLNLKPDAESELLKTSNAAYVCRTLCRLINSQNDKFLIGNWTEDCSSGMRPTTWNGSVPIFQHWLRKGSVPFGQCWVFAGVLCTALRCLGIPARVTTVFESARNFDKQFNVDCLYLESGKLLPDRPTVWTFQSWNEVWLRRDEEVPHVVHNGWHALISDAKDCTDGSECTRFGPTSLKAVKEGEMSTLNDDCGYVFAKTNSQLVEWITDCQLPEKVVYTSDQTVGQFIGTKARGALTEADLTEDYKYPEGSANAGEIMAKARHASSQTDILMYQRQPKAREATIIPNFEVSLEQHGQTQVGEDLHATLTLKNTTSEKKEIEVNLNVASILYSKVPVKDIQNLKVVIGLEPNKEKDIPLSLNYDEYKDAITPDNLIQMIAVCKDRKGVYLVSRKVMPLQNPQLLIEVLEDPVFNKPFSVEITFSNPLPVTLENCHLFVEGSGLLRESIALMFPYVQPGESATEKIILHPYRPGKRYLLVNFSCDKISDVKAYKEIIIPPLEVEYKY